MAQLTRRERLTRQARGQEVDRVPTIGGWMNGVANLADLGGTSVQEYLRDPERGVVRANRALEVDGMVGPNVPTRRDQVRSGHVTEADHRGREPEDLVAAAAALPDTEAGVLAGFDAVAAGERCREHFVRARRDWGGLEPIPNFWELGGPFPLYQQFGYEAFLVGRLPAAALLRPHPHDPGAPARGRGAAWCTTATATCAPARRRSTGSTRPLTPGRGCAWGWTGRGRRAPAGGAPARRQGGRRSPGCLQPRDST